MTDKEEFEVDDEVYYIGESSTPIYLMKGKILFISDHERNVFMEFDIPTGKTHDNNSLLNGLGKKGYCWYATSKYVTKDKGKVLKRTLDGKEGG